jgi:hypothetical protein
LSKPAREVRSGGVAVFRLFWRLPDGQLAILAKSSSAGHSILQVLCGFLLLIVFSSKAVLQSTERGEAVLGATLAQTQSATVAPSSSDDSPPPSRDLPLPPDFERHTDDLGAMVERLEIRALVIVNPIGFFYDNGLPRGAMYEALIAMGGSVSSFGEPLAFRRFVGTTRS